MSKLDLINLENDWKRSTVEGNHLMEKFCDQALLEYNTAFAKAKKLMNHLTSCINSNIPILHIYLISCNNLTEAYFRTGKLKLADKMHRRAIFYTLFLQEKKAQQLNEEEIARAIHRQLLSYKDFTTDSNTPEEFEKLIGQIKSDSAAEYFN
jgi:hypothetical protein